MKKPFKKGMELEYIEHGWLTSLNSTSQHQEDSRMIASNRYPDEDPEDIRSVAAGIMRAWSRRKNWTH